jgi:hypothetical protein
MADGRNLVSRAMCNRILAVSAVVALLIVLNYTLAVQRPQNPVAVIPEIVGKTALLWTGVAFVLGVLGEAFFLLTGRGRRAD